jgi:hypothetical protein
MTDAMLYRRGEGRIEVHDERGVFRSGEGIYLLTEAVDPDEAQWLHPAHGLVDLVQIEQAGKIQSEVEPIRLQNGDVGAIEHFGLTPADLSPGEWQKIYQRRKRRKPNPKPKRQAQKRRRISPELRRILRGY